MTIDPGFYPSCSQQIGNSEAEDLLDKHEADLTEAMPHLRALRIIFSRMEARGAYGPTGYDLDGIIETIEDCISGEWSKDYIEDAAYEAGQAA